MIKGAIFDVDGTLLDSMCIWLDAGERYLRKCGLEPEEGLGEKIFTMTLEEGAAYVKKGYHLPQSEDEIVSEVLEIVREFYHEEAPLKEGAKAFLQALQDHDIPMVVATSGNQELVEAAFTRLGILHYFERIFTCTEVGVGKRYPDIYRCAAQYLGTRPEETYVFEDVLHAVRSAGSAGFRTVGIYDASSDKEQEEIRKSADIYLGDLTDFSKFWEYAEK